MKSSFSKAGSQTYFQINTCLNSVKFKPGTSQLEESMTSFSASRRVFEATHRLALIMTTTIRVQGGPLCFLAVKGIFLLLVKLKVSRELLAAIHRCVKATGLPFSRLLSQLFLDFFHINL